MRVRTTWPDLYRAIHAATYDAAADGVRQRVIREDGVDEWGPYRFRSLPATPLEVAEPCS